MDRHVYLEVSVVDFLFSGIKATSSPPHLKSPSEVLPTGSLTANPISPIPLPEQRAVLLSVSRCAAVLQLSAGAMISLCHSYPRPGGLLKAQSTRQTFKITLWLITERKGETQWLGQHTAFKKSLVIAEVHFIYCWNLSFFSLNIWKLCTHQEMQWCL